MVQIIQSQPTQRQSALELAGQQAVQNFGQSYLQGQETQRQQALKALDTAIQLRGQGYDVNPQQVQQMYAQPQAGFGDVFSKRTAEFTAKQERESQKALKEQEKFQADIEKTAAETAKLGRVDPLENLKADELRQRLKLGKAQESKYIAEAAKIAKEAAMTGGSSKLDQKLVETQAVDLAKKTSNLYSVKTAMDKALNQLSDPNRTDEEKVKTGQGLLKLLNSAEGSDAVGAEEAKRIGDYLEFAMGNFTGPGGMRVGRDLPGFLSQVENYSALLGERIKGNEQGLQAIKSGVPLSQLNGRVQSPSGGLTPQQAQRLQELRAKAGG